MGSVEDRERLKEEYKEHYRSIRELRKKAEESERMAKIASTLDKMNAGAILETFDNALQKVREKIELAEAKLEMALDSRKSDQTDAELESELQKRKAAETISRIKSEMGNLHSEIDDKVAQLQLKDKTLGPVGKPASQPNDIPPVNKSLGPARKTK